MNKKFEDPAKGRTVLLNICSRTELVAFPEMKESYDLFYPAYQPDMIVLDAIRQLLAEQRIKIILGTWCGDSKVQVSNFFKITDHLGIEEKNITLICVDGSKQAENGLLNDLDIEQVPTFIIYKENRELGRIVENPKTTLENDLLSILNNKQCP